MLDLKKINNHFGNIDIYLLDQILKDRFHPGMKVLDAGCGEGRNLMFFLHSGYNTYGVDRNPNAIRALRFLASSLRPDLKAEQFLVSELARLPFEGHFFDLIIASAVLHFAESHEDFMEMFVEILRCLKPKGILFVRMTSNIGIEDKVKPLGSNRYLIPDGTERYLLSRETLKELVERFSLEFIEPLKTVNVNDLRCMSTLVLNTAKGI